MRLFDGSEVEKKPPRPRARSAEGPAARRDRGDRLLTSHPSGAGAAAGPSPPAPEGTSAGGPRAALLRRGRLVQSQAHALRLALPGAGTYETVRRTVSPRPPALVAGLRGLLLNLAARRLAAAAALLVGLLAATPAALRADGVDDDVKALKDLDKAG